MLKDIANSRKERHKVNIEVFSSNDKEKVIQEVYKYIFEKVKEINSSRMDIPPTRKANING